MKVAWVCVVSGVALVLYACSGSDGASFDSVPSSGGSASAEGGASSGGAQAGSAGNANSGGATSIGGTAGAGTGGNAGTGGANAATGGVSSNGGSQSNNGGTSANPDGGSTSAGASGDGGTGTSEGDGGSGSGGGPGADAVTITLSELDDTYADSLAPTVTHGAEVTVLVDTSPAVYQSFIKPTSLAAIPSGASIVSAKLVLHCVDVGNEVAAHYAASSWSEGALTWNNKPTAGDPIVSFTPALGAVEIDITSAVAAWLDGAPLNGIVLTQGGTDGSDYSSTEEPTEASRPYISVTYQP